MSDSTTIDHHDVGADLPSPPAAYRLTLISVTGVVIVATRRSRTMIGSVEELTKFYKSVLVHNLTLGWWAIPGLIWTAMAFGRNRNALNQLHQIAASGQAAPGWFADPTHRHATRYWDGRAWTAQVSDIQSDPLPEA